MLNVKTWIIIIIALRRRRLLPWFIEAVFNKIKTDHHNIFITTTTKCPQVYARKVVDIVNIIKSDSDIWMENLIFRFDINGTYKKKPSDHIPTNV